MYSIKFFTDDDYLDLCKWWSKHGHRQVPLSSLAQIGIVVLKEDTKIAMSFLYTTNCNLAQIGWTTSNPECSNRDSYKAIVSAVEYLLSICRKMNITHVASFSNSTGLSKILNRTLSRSVKDHTLHIGEI